MSNNDFWASIQAIIGEGFTADGQQQLEYYAEQFATQQLVYKRFSSFEQHGCSTGGVIHVIATLLAAAEDRTDNAPQKPIDYQSELKRGARQIEVI